MPSVLYVVATPIGNLQDITERARAVFSTVDGLLCEDTRRGAQLLRALGLESKPAHRLDAHVSDAVIAAVVARLQAGESLALVTDAGTPGVSDPGARLVHAAREAGVRVVALPGASAVATLVSLLGAESEAEEQSPAFEFVGFLPRQGLSKLWLQWLAGVGVRSVRRVLAFESPHRIVSALQEVAQTEIPVASSAVSIRCVVAKELTKVHERVWAGTPVDVAHAVAQEVAREGALGEWCVGWVFTTMDADRSQGRVIPEEESVGGWSWRRALQMLIDLEVPVSRAVSAICQEFGAPKNAVYAQALAFAESHDSKK